MSSNNNVKLETSLQDLAMVLTSGIPQGSSIDISLVITLMKRVETIKKLPGAQKKILVINCVNLIIEREIEDIGVQEFTKLIMVTSIDQLIAIDKGKIQAVSDDPIEGTLLDKGDLVIMPGLVDTHVHVNEPGRTDWEGFETATRACAAGGITTVVDMPLNCLPVTTTKKNLEEKLESIKGKLFVVGEWMNWEMMKKARMIL